LGCDKLFVYGTLLSRVTGRLGAGERRRLEREAVSLGEAHVKGFLRDLGDYPGLVVPGETRDIVYGEVLELRNPVETLAWLDVYEGVGSVKASPADEYRRQILYVNLASGGNCEAWSYVLRQSIDGSPRVAGGRWRDRRA